MPREDALLDDMVAAAELIADFIRGTTFDSFTSDTRTYWATVSQLMIVGEAVKGLSIRPLLPEHE